MGELNRDNCDLWSFGGFAQRFFLWRLKSFQTKWRVESSTFYRRICARTHTCKTAPEGAVSVVFVWFRLTLRAVQLFLENAQPTESALSPEHLV